MKQRQMNTAYLTALLDRLRAKPRKSEWLEFKVSRLVVSSRALEGEGVPAWR